jgi:hypothetical protein
MKKQAPRARLLVELLECRIVLDADPIRLEIIALHEFGHALGLAHHDNPASIMYDSYNAGYDLSLLANDPAVVVDETDGYASLLELYSASNVASNTSPWWDVLDPAPGNGVVEISWSIMPDGTPISDALNIINQAFDAQYGPGWRATLSEALNSWAGVSQGRISFLGWGDAGKPFNYAGRAQNDLDSGDIRIGAYHIDGPGGKLAQSYFPAPNGNSTGPGDVFFDADEAWMQAPGPVGGGSGSSSDGSGSPWPPGGSGTPGHDTSATGSGGTGPLSNLSSAALVADEELPPAPLAFTPPQEPSSTAPGKPTTGLTPVGRPRHPAAALTLKRGGKAASKLSILSAGKSLAAPPFRAL